VTKLVRKKTKTKIEFTTTHYVRDVSGNILATYEHTHIQELNIYGSNRLGTYNIPYEADPKDTTKQKQVNDFHKLILGRRYYELKNHLGNLLAIISDKKILNGSTFEADVVSANDYYPFGMNIALRTFVNEEYRFGYQGSEKDNDLGENNYTTHFRQLDTEVTKWWSTDPKTTAWESPYVSMGNNPILYNDILGDTMAVFKPDGTFWKFEDDGKKEWTGMIYQETKRTISEDGKSIITTYSNPLEFKFADPKNDPKDIKSGTITKLIIINEAIVADMMGRNGAFEADMRSFKEKSTSGEVFDYSYTVIPKYFPEVSKSPNTRPSPLLFLLKTDMLITT